MPIEAFMERSSKEGRESCSGRWWEVLVLGERRGEEEGKGEVLVDGSAGELEMLGERKVLIVAFALVSCVHLAPF